MESGLLKTKNYYDGIAKGYSELYHEEQKRKIELIKNYFENGLTLDLGCGDGVLNQYLSNIVSVDLSFELLKLNKNKNKVNSSAINLPFKNNTFKSVISITMIQDIENVEKVINEIYRVLKEEGILILTFLKFSKKVHMIKDIVYAKFDIKKEMEEEKDLIVIARK